MSLTKKKKRALLAWLKENEKVHETMKFLGFENLDRHNFHFELYDIVNDPGRSQNLINKLKELQIKSFKTVD